MNYIDDINKHALECFPEECCGFVKDGKYIPLNNIAKDKENAFKIHKNHYAKHQPDMIVHSHTVRRHNRLFDDRTPSKSDMIGQRDTDIPWLIVATDGHSVSKPITFPVSLDEEIEGQEFTHCIRDCLTVVRKYYWQNHKKIIKDRPRDYNFQNNNEDLYNDHYAEEGFYSVPLTDLKKGDLVLMQIKSPVLNHAGIFLGENKMLHHLVGHISGVDKLSTWMPLISKAIRYGGDKND